MRSGTTCLRVMHRQAKQSQFTLVGLLHFVHNYMVENRKSLTVNRKLQIQYYLHSSRLKSYCLLSDVYSPYLCNSLFLSISHLQLATCYLQLVSMNSWWIFLSPFPIKILIIFQNIFIGFYTLIIQNYYLIKIFYIIRCILGIF